MITQLLSKSYSKTNICGSVGQPTQLMNVGKKYDEIIALSNFTLDIGAGEFVTLLGPSGSGKSTTLELIAGFKKPTEGRIFIGQQDITDLPTQRRYLGMVFQSYAIFPHMTVFDNVAFPLTLRGVRGKKLQDAVEKALEIVSLSQSGQRRPQELSGGQMQRVALARGFVHSPPVLLMDEPLSALDRRLRQQMQSELRRIHREIGTTVVYVTHDQEEALSLSDRIVLLHNSHIVQIGSPQEVYENPHSKFTANFLGTANFLTAEVGRAARGNGIYEATTSNGLVIQGRASEQLKERNTTVVLRAEDAHVQPSPAGTSNSLVVRVMEKVFLGDRVRCLGKFANDESCEFWLDHGQAVDVSEGEKLTIYWPVERTVFMNASREE